jgi:hypothetical protein
MLLSFTNGDGDTFEIRGNYLLSPNWSGFGNMPINLQSTKAPYQDGRTYIDAILEEKELVLEFTIIGDTRQSVFDRRRTVASMFNPKRGIGTLKWLQEDGTEFHIECIPLGPEFPGGDGQGNTFQSVIVSFMALSPYWFDPVQVQRTMVGFSGGWSFPLSFPLSFGEVGTQIDVENDGDLETPIMIYLYGEIVTPVIENVTTDEKITVNKTIDDGDIMIINTAFGEKSVMILSGGVYTDAFEDVDPESVFWSLEPGANTIKYTSASEGENAECRIYYYNRYGGV